MNEEESKERRWKGNAGRGRISDFRTRLVDEKNSEKVSAKCRNSSSSHFVSLSMARSPEAEKR